jgi:hypothetical protein
MMEKIQYFISVDGWGANVEYYHVTDDLETVAESFVEENDYDGDGGSEFELEIFDAGMNSLGVFTVYKEYTVNYSAYEKRVK